MKYLGFKYDNKFNLSDRELEVLKFLVEGLDNQQISNKLYISVHTAKAHVANILRKMNARNRTQACLIAIKENLLYEFDEIEAKGA